MTSRQANSEKGFGSWLQASLFTRSAGSYFSPLVQELAPSMVFAKAYQQARVIKIIRHHQNATTLTIEPPRSWQGFMPGQYVSCEFEINGVRIKRNYSISNSYVFFQKTGLINITVHRVEGGKMSNFILDELPLGARFSLSEAMGEFGAELEKQPYEQKKSPVLFLAAGSGITPCASILASAQQGLRKTFLIYSCVKSNQHLFSESFQKLAEQQNNFQLCLHTTQQNESDKRIDKQLIKKFCKTQGYKLEDFEVFVCGSNSFSESMISELKALGMKESAIYFESFDSKFDFSDKGDKASKVNFSESGKSIEGTSNTSLLEQAESLGLNPQSGCRMGVCHSCTCTKKSGQVRNLLTGETSSTDEEEIRICISQALGEVDIAL
jgi:ferredoxin-NADP reductase